MPMLSGPQIESSQRIFMTDHQLRQQTIILQPFTSANIDDFMEWATDDEVTKYM